MIPRPETYRPAVVSPRVPCPECRGEKTILCTIFEGAEVEMQCHLCDGAGTVSDIVASQHERQAAD